VSIYLTSHYFAVKFPTGLDTVSSICDFGSFFNCDTATNSVASNIFGVPISICGILIGLFIIAGFAIKTDEMEGTLFQVLAINFAGCVLLFFYSLIALGSLCPFCTLYYILSGSALFIFFKKSNNRLLAPVPLAAYGVISAV